MGMPAEQICSLHQYLVQQHHEHKTASQTAYMAVALASVRSHQTLYPNQSHAPSERALVLATGGRWRGVWDVFPGVQGHSTLPAAPALRLALPQRPEAATPLRRSLCDVCGVNIACTCVIDCSHERR